MGDWKEAYKNIRSRQNETNENQLSDNLYTDKGLDSKYQPLSPLTDVNEHAGVNQTKSDIAGNILARGVGTFVTGALGTVAMLHDIPKSMYKAVTGDSDKHEGWDYYMNNSINADLVKAQEDVMKEFPLYDTYKDSKTPFTAKKVLDGITQGAAFIGSAWAGGWLTKGILQSAKLLGNSQKLINFTNKTGKSLAVDNAVNAQLVNYLDKSKNIGAAIYNRSFESMLEAKGTGQEIREKLESENQEAFDKTGQYLYNPEDIDNRVRQAEKLNFGFNLALGAIDAYQNLKIFDGFESKIGKAISKNIDDVTESVLSNKNLSRFGLPKLTALGVKYGTKTGALSATGGLEALEELAQFSSNKLSQDLATNNYTKDDWDNLPKLILDITGQMTDDIQNDPNAQFSALIGGLVGLPMGMVSKRSEDRQESLKSKQREIAQQSLIEKNVLVGLYKIKNGKTLEDKVSGEIQTRFSNHQGFQNTVINQINADNFEGLISHLENIKETSIDDLKELEIGVKTDSKGNTIQPSTIINEAIEQAKAVKKVYESVNLAHANKSELVRNNITNLILNGKYFDKKIDLVTNELEAKKAEILNKLTKDQNYAEKAFKTVKSKETGKEDLSFFVNGEIKNANIEELDINPETKDEVIKLKEELKQLNKERESTIKEYNKYKEPSYIGKVEKEAQKNIENLEKPNESVTKESIVSTPTDTTKDDKKIQYNSLLNNKKAYEYHLKNAKTPEDKLKIEEALLKIEEQLKQFSEYNPVDKNTSEKVTDNLTYLQDTYDKFKSNIKNASINKLYYILEKIRENYKLSQRALSQLKLEELQGNPPTQEDYDIVMLIQKINKSKLDLVEELIVKHEIEEENKKLKELLLIEEFTTSTGETKLALRQKEIEQAFKQNTVQNISEDGRVFNINDKQYRVGYSDMLMAINRNVNGDIISVELLNDRNETVTFKSQPLLDEIVFNILATKLTNKNFTSETEIDNKVLNEIEEKIQNNDVTDLESDLIEIQELINQLEEVIEFEKNEFIEAGFSKKEVKEYINQSKNYKTLQDLKEVEKEILKQIKVLNKPVKIKTVKEKVKKIAVKKPIVKKEKVTKINQNDDITTETGDVTSETSEGTIEQIIEGEEQNNAKLSSETEVNESIDTSTDNTYYEAPDTFLSASEANNEDIFVPENIEEELPTKSLEELSNEIKAKKADIERLKPQETELEAKIQLLNEAKQKELSLIPINTKQDVTSFTSGFKSAFDKFAEKMGFDKEDKTKRGTINDVFRKYGYGTSDEIDSEKANILYKEYAKKIHPDKFQDKILKEIANEFITQLNQAKEESNVTALHNIYKLFIETKYDAELKALEQPSTTQSEIELKNEGKADAPTLENIDSRLRLGHPFYEKVSDALDKLGLIKKYNPETKEGDVIGGVSQKTSDGGFKIGKIKFKKDGSIVYIDGFNLIDFDKNGNVISENTKEVKAQETQNTIKSLKESIISFENLRDSEAFKYKEITQISPLGDKTKIKVLKTEQELKASTDKINAQIDKSKAELRALEQTTPQSEIEANKKVKEIPENPKLKYKTFDSNEPMFVNKEFIYFDGKTYTSYKFDEQAASTIIKDSDLVLKPLTNNGYGAIGVFTTDNKLVSILRMQHFTDVNDPNDRGGLVNIENEKLFEQFFGQPFENGGKLKDISKRTSIVAKHVKAFNVSFNSLNIGSPLTVTLKPTVETALDKNIHYDNNGVPTIVRLIGSDIIQPKVITGDSSINTDKIQLSDSNRSGDTILLFTERNAHNNPDKQVYPAVPITVKSIGETETFKNKIVSLLNETVNGIQNNILNGEKGKINETVSDPNFKLHVNLLTELRNFVRYSEKTIESEVSKNISDEFVLKATFPDNSKPIEVTITKDTIEGLEEFKDKLMKVIPSFSVESIQALKESGKFDVNDYLEAMTIAVKEDQPIKGISIEIFTGLNKKDVIPAQNIEKKLTSNDLVLKETKDIIDSTPIDITEKTTKKLDFNLVPTKSNRKVSFNKEVNSLTKESDSTQKLKISEFIKNSTHMEDSIRLSAIKDYLKGNENALTEACK